MVRSLFNVGFACLCALSISNAIEISEELLRGILTKLESLEEKNDQLEETVLAQRKDNLRLQEQNEEIRARIDQAEKIITKTDSWYKQDSKKRLILGQDLPIAFTARIKPKLVDHVSPLARIPFNDVLTNFGRGFNTSTSIFVAPMAGIYLFSCSLFDHLSRPDRSSVMLHADILKNGKTVLGRVFAHAEGASYRDQGAQTVFAQLIAGDEVWVRDWDSKDLSVGGELYSTFSGYLLWPME